MGARLRVHFEQLHLVLLNLETKRQFLFRAHLNAPTAYVNAGPCTFKSRLESRACSIRVVGVWRCKVELSVAV